MNRLLLTLTTILCLTGCMQVGKTTLPEPTAGFAPKTAYAVTPDQLWDASLRALEKNRIPVTASDKAAGTLQTDHVPGPSSLIGLGLIAAQSTRYQYHLTTRGQADGTTRLTVLCKVESTMKGGSGASQWTDVSGDNAGQVRRLETWLYEQIEAELPKP